MFKKFFTKTPTNINPIENWDTELLKTIAENMKNDIISYQKIDLKYFTNQTITLLHNKTFHHCEFREGNIFLNAGKFQNLSYIDCDFIVLNSAAVNIHTILRIDNSNFINCVFVKSLICLPENQVQESLKTDCNIISYYPVKTLSEDSVIPFRKK